MSAWLLHSQLALWSDIWQELFLLEFLPPPAATVCHTLAGGNCQLGLMMSFLSLITRAFSNHQPYGAGGFFGRSFEALEARNLFAADLSINSFTADGENLVVDFNIADEMTEEFNIAIYRSFDGISLDQILVTQRIDCGLGVGSHQVVIPAAFSDLLSDFQLVAVIDDGSEIEEYSEWNNQATFVGGVFVDVDSIIQVHGTDHADLVSAYDDGYLHIDLNGSSYAYDATEIAGIAIRTHAGGDWVLADYNLTQAVLAFGGDGNDVLLGGAGNDIFFGGNGSDYLSGGNGNDSLSGEGGDDVLSGDDGDDQLDGGEGVDTVMGGAGSDTLGLGFDDSSHYGYGDTLDAGEGDDIIYGTNGDDIIYGGGGNDTIYGLGGNDQLFGEDGDDILLGGDGDDYLYGGKGDDTLYGYGGYDSLFGEDGDDYLYGGIDNDYLVGGSGHDLHNTGGESGDTVGDRPYFSNFSYSYRSRINQVFVSGSIIDDEPLTDLFVTYSGAAEGSIPLSETGEFSYFISVPTVPSKWLFLDFTDAEGLQAQRMIMSLT